MAVLLDIWDPEGQIHLCCPIILTRVDQQLCLKKRGPRHNFPTVAPYDPVCCMQQLLVSNAESHIFNAFWDWFRTGLGNDLDSWQTMSISGIRMWFSNNASILCSLCFNLICSIASMVFLKTSLTSLGHPPDIELWRWWHWAYSEVLHLEFAWPTSVVPMLPLLYACCYRQHLSVCGAEPMPVGQIQMWC